MTFDKNLNIQNMEKGGKYSTYNDENGDIPRVKYIYQGGKIERIKDGIMRSLSRNFSPKGNMRFDL